MPLTSHECQKKIPLGKEYCITLSGANRGGIIIPGVGTNEATKAHYLGDWWLWEVARMAT